MRRRKVSAYTAGRCSWPVLSLPTGCTACADLPLPKESRARRFDREVPVDYADTDPAHRGLHPLLVTAAQAWRVDGGKGLGFSGPSGHGKTRLLCLALRRAEEAGASIAFCSALKLAALASDQFHDEARRRDTAEQRLRYLFGCRVLLLDDLGKEKLTERTASVLTGLIEEHTSKCRPLLWSSQYNSAELIARLGDDRGKAIVRRLREFTALTRLDPARSTKSPAC